MRSKNSSRKFHWVPPIVALCCVSCATTLDFPTVTDPSIVCKPVGKIKAPSGDEYYLEAARRRLLEADDAKQVTHLGLPRTLEETNQIELKSYICPNFVSMTPAMIESLCEDGDVEACIHAGFTAGKYSTLLSQGFFEKACRLKNITACDHLKELKAKSKRDEEIAAKQKKEKEATEAKRIAIETKTQSLHDKCKSKSAKACIDLLQRDDNTINSPTDTKERISIAERACMNGSATGCELMKIYLTQEANEATIAAAKLQAVAANRQAAAAEEAAETASRAEWRAIIEGISNSFVRKPSGSRTTCKKNWTGQVECETRDSY